MSIRKRLLVAVCGVMLCVGAASAQVIVRMGPPPPVVVERPGRASHAGWVWIPGYYRWNGRRYYLGSGTLGGATPASCNLGARPMGSSWRWMGLGQRILALEPAARACVAKIKLTPTG